MAISGKSSTVWAEVGEDGRLVLPHEMIERFNLRPGARVRLEESGNSIRLHRPLNQLTKVYIEPTVECNLDCITCFRNAWDQPLGRMSEETFASILASLKKMDPIPSVYFGGIGEPLFHPKTADWIRQVKQLGVKVELITNGTILTERKSRQLIDAGLDVLWVSLDGATPETYADIRLGAELQTILNNLDRFSKMRKGGHYPIPEIGIAFVAMQRNIADLPDIIKIGKSLRAKYFSISNLQPPTAEMQSERLYQAHHPRHRLPAGPASTPPQPPQNGF